MLIKVYLKNNEYFYILSICGKDKKWSDFFISKKIYLALKDCVKVVKKYEED